MKSKSLNRTVESMKHMMVRTAAVVMITFLTVSLAACTGGAKGEESSEQEDAPAPGASIDMSLLLSDVTSSILQLAEKIPQLVDPDLLHIEVETVLDGVTPDGFHEPYFQSFRIPDDTFEEMKGKSFKEDGQIDRNDLRYLKMAYLDYDGATRMGEMVVNKKCAEDVLAVFRELYEAEYQIKKMCLVDQYYDLQESDDRDTESDNQSIIDDNTSAFNYRSASNNHNVLSNHAFGFAIDLNPVENPYINADGTLDGPPSSEPFMDRSGASEDNHMLKDGDICVTIFKKHGFTWGGNWSGDKDYQHFDWAG